MLAASLHNGRGPQKNQKNPPGGLPTTDSGRAPTEGQNGPRAVQGQNKTQVTTAGPTKDWKQHHKNERGRRTTKRREGKRQLQTKEGGKPNHQKEGQQHGPKGKRKRRHTKRERFGLFLLLHSFCILFEIFTNTENDTSSNVCFTKLQKEWFRPRQLGKTNVSGWSPFPAVPSVLPLWVILISFLEKDHPRHEWKRRKRHHSKRGGKAAPPKERGNTAPLAAKEKRNKVET